MFGVGGGRLRDEGGEGCRIYTLPHLHPSPPGLGYKYRVQPPLAVRLEEVVPGSGFRVDSLGRSQDVCKGARFPVDGERCVVKN